MLDVMNALDHQQSLLVTGGSPCQMGKNDNAYDVMSYIFLMWCCDLEGVQSVLRRHRVGFIEEKQWILSATSSLLFLMSCRKEKEDAMGKAWVGRGMMTMAIPGTLWNAAKNGWRKSLHSSYSRYN
jgi:hypothetical protein